MSEHTERVQGSISNKIVATELVEERANCDFKQIELYQFLIGDEEVRRLYDEHIERMKSDPNTRQSHKVYDMTR